MKHKLFTLFLALVAGIGTLLANPMRIPASSKMLKAPAEDLNLGEPTFESKQPHKAPQDQSISSVKEKIGDLYYEALYYDSIRTTFIPPKIFVTDTIKILVDVVLTSSPDEDKYAGDIVIPASIEYSGETFDITHIGREVFAKCTGLTSVTISNSVTSIGEYAFWGCSSLTSVTIPNSVTRIGEYAFSYCNGLTSVTIPNSVISIGRSAFSGCSGLTSIEVDTTNPNFCSLDGVLFNKDATILIQYPKGKHGEYNIPYSVISIGRAAFADCDGLLSVTIPNNVTNIGDYAFEGCDSLPSVTISHSVTSIGKLAFDVCPELTSINVASENPNYCDLGGVLFNKSKTTLIQYPIKKAATEYTIPSSVTIIEEGAFYGECKLQSLICEATTPPTNGTIGFSGMSALVGINKENCIVYVPAESLSAYKTADMWKEFLNILPIEDEPAPCIIASGTCGTQGDNLTWTLTCDSVLTISGTGAMANFVQEGTTPWESNIEYIKAVIIEEGITSIGDHTFGGCSSLTTLTIPNSVTSIGNNAFYGCINLTSVTIPNSVTNIGNRAFYGCGGLTSVTMGNGVTSIGIFAFSFCDGLTSVTIGSSVTNIGSYAFHTCTSMTSVTIPNSVTTIGDYAFNGCNSLTSVSIPRSVTNIKTGAFIYCHSLNSIDVSSDNANYSSIDGVLFSKDATQLIIYPAGKQGEYVVPNGTKTIIAQAFADCGKITSVIIPNSVTSIEEYAFAECSALETITIGANVSNLGEGAFWACSNIKTIYNYVTTPQSITSVMFDGYEDYPAVDKTTCKLYVPAESVALYKAADVWKEFLNILPIEDEPAPCIIASGTCGTQGDNLTWTLTCDSVLTISGTGAMANFEQEGTTPWESNIEYIKAVIIEEGITSIGDHTFGGCSSLTSVTIPNSVTSIGIYAFKRCTGLTSVTIPNSVTSIGDYAFDGCTGLTSVTIPNSVTSIGWSAFEYCTGLTSVTMGNSVTSIGWSAFYYCTGLTSLTIPNSVTSIGRTAFYRCSSLTSVTMGNSVTIIGEHAFYGCTNLTAVHISDIAAWCIIDFNDRSSNPLYYAKHLYVNEIEVTNLAIPNSVTSIGNNAFYGCINLTSVTIPNSVTNIGNRAFYGCGGLTSLTIGNSVTSIGDFTFGGCSSLTTLTIPNNVTSIGDGTFSACSGLISLTIPNSVTSIGNKAFYNCSVLKSITNYATTPQQIESDVFGGVSNLELDKSTCKLYVPAESIALYQSADVWKEFTNILPIEGTSATPSVTDVRNAGYNPDNNIVFCVHFTEEATVCNDIVWAGTYNGWNTNIDQMLTFSHLVGFDNWYAVEFPYAEETAGVPVSLKLDGSFSWDYICGPGNAWMYKGGKEAFITNVLDDKIDAIRFYDGAGVYMYEMTYWNQHRDPCVQLPVHTYTVNVYAPNACSDMKPAVIGDFNNWDIYSVSAMSELTDTNGKKYYSYSFNDEELHSFKIVAADEYEVDWNTEMKHFDATKGGWVTVENYILSADSIITLDWSDNRHYRYGTCETGLPDPTTYTITFVNDDGSIIDSRAWEEGTMPTCAEPSKPDDDYMYCFAGWQPQIVAVSDTSTYQATYDVCGGWISASVYWKLQGDTLMVDGSGVIPDYAQGTAPWGSYAGSVNVVYIEDGISRIGEWAFADMSMSVVRIPEDVSVIGANAFKGCTFIKNVYFGGNASQWATINFVNEYSNPLYYGATLYDAKLEIPVTHTISTNAFIGMSTVVYHGTLEQWCTMTFTSDYIPSYDLIIDGEIVSNPCFGEGLTAISAYAFRGCRSIRSVCIPASMQQIGSDAFSHTPNLNKVLYAGTLAQWCDITFANAEANPACHADLYFDDEKLGTRIDIPASLTSIRAFAFPNKETLNVYFHGTNPNGYMLNSFGEPQEVGNKHFYVPCGTMEDYQTQLNYNESLFTENYPFSYQVLSGQEAMGKVQIVHAPNCEDQQLQIKAIPNAEHRFVQWSDGNTEAERTLILYSDTILKASFAIDSVTIRFLMDDGTLYVEKNVKYGEMPIVEDPQKESTVQYTYTFARWNPELKPATYDMSYKAVFGRTVNTYMVYFVNWDGTLLGEQEVAYGSAALPPAVPEREHYHFVGWNTNINMITGRTFAVAQFKKNGGYTIHYRNGVDDSEIDGEEIDLNFPEPPVIEGFVFVGWEIVCGSVITEGIEIQAVYEPSTANAIGNEVVNPANPVQKLIRNGNVYILTDDNTYTIQGQKVK